MLPCRSMPDGVCKQCALLAVGILVALIWPMNVHAVAYVQGFDVYSGDGTVNFYSAANGGYQFAFVKATEGVNFVDSNFTTNMLHAYQVNDPSLHSLPANAFYVGPYHFARAESKDGVKFTSYDGKAFTPNATNIDAWQDATSEANDFIDAVRPYYFRTFSGNKSSVPSYFLPPVLDIEQKYMPDFGSQSLRTTFVSNWVQLFSDVVYSALGVRPIIYASESAQTRTSRQPWPANITCGRLGIKVREQHRRRYIPIRQTGRSGPTGNGATALIRSPKTTQYRARLIVWTATCLTAHRRVSLPHKKCRH